MRLFPKFPHFLMLSASLSIAACSGSPSSDKNGAPEANASSGHSEEQKKNLANFDDLDFRVYSGQKWDEFNKSHAEDILVHYPDGSTTTGIADHLVKLKPQFAFAPDTKIAEHPIKLADGKYTAVQGIMTGTFTKPMDLGGGKTLQPTGKKFVLPMMTVGRWENGVMKEEWLFWDNASFMVQIGAT
ncbi:MAG: ester cyclase [Sphingopyxis sp.]|uniref:ester cyclase n=1 Tax=Sphingopyxis sp. TaxID=1908224 RepID=UPI003D6CBA62